jgi:multidrug resistance efflux pump
MPHARGSLAIDRGRRLNALGNIKGTSQQIQHADEGEAALWPEPRAVEKGTAHAVQQKLSVLIRLDKRREEPHLRIGSCATQRLGSPHEHFRRRDGRFTEVGDGVAAKTQTERRRILDG